jgi:peroxiredoxin
MRRIRKFMFVNLFIAAGAFLVWFAAGLGAKPLEVGKPAPDFALPDQNGTVHKLSDLRGKTVVLAFYPMDMTPGCTLENRSLSASLEDFKKRNVAVFGISSQDSKSKQAFCEKEGLKHSLLADEGGKVAEKYGIRLPNGFASRVTFIVNPQGEIAAVLDSVNTREHGKQVLEAIEAIEETVEPGKRVKDFSLPNARDGKSVNLLGDGKQKATVVMFISTRCPVSLAYDARMRSIAAEFETKGVRFVAINSNVAEMPQEIKEHAAKAGFSFAVLKDEGNVIADRFKALVTPEIFLLDSQAVVRYHGRIDDNQDPNAVKSNDLREALKAVLAGNAPANPKTRAVGCTIKRAGK